MNNYDQSCPVCTGSDELIIFPWGNYSVIHCNKCELDYCSEMIEKEIGGDSSPVHLDGVEMMANAFHHTYDLALQYVRERKNIYERFLKRKCDKILEVGCGPGVFYKPWLASSVDWSGVDINPYWKEFGSKNDVPISNESTDVLTEKYDVITAHQVIEHVEDPISFMKSLVALLNPGGIIHLELPNQDSLTARMRQVSSKISFDYGFIQPPMHLRAYRKETINHLFNHMNLESKSVFVCGNTNKVWGQVRDYSLYQKLLYSISGRIGLGSVLVGIAQYHP